jgi:Domain of Unknown Function (DUF349)
MSKEKTAKNNYGYIKGKKVYRNAFLDQPEMEIGVVREGPEKSLEYFENRFQNLESKITKLEDDIRNASNKGSFLMKLLHLKEKLMKFNGLGDFESLISRMEVVKGELEGSISENRERNLVLKKDFIKELKELMKCPDEELVEVTEKVKENKNKWVRTGSVTEKKQKALEAKYELLLDKFFDRKKEFVSKQREELRKITVQYGKLIGQVGRMRMERDRERVRREIEGIKKRWNELPAIPENVRAALDRKLEFKIKQILEPRPPRREGRFQPPRQGGGSRSFQNFFPPEMLKEKEELLKQALELKKMDLNEAVKHAKFLQERWLNSGKSSAPDIRNIYNNFREIIASIFEKKTLEINVLKKYPEFPDKSDSEKKILQISIMRELIRKAKSDFRTIQENLDMANSEDRGNVDRALLTKAKNQNFRIRIRETLLRDIEMG